MLACATIRITAINCGLCSVRITPVFAITSCGTDSYGRCPRSVSAEIIRVNRRISAKFFRIETRNPAKMNVVKKKRKKPQNPLDTDFQKRRRGRPGVFAPEIYGRAEHYRIMFEQAWDLIGEPLLQAKTVEQVLSAYRSGNFPINVEFPNFAELTLRVLSDRKFPERAKAQIRFLADSLAAMGRVSPRRSRDICTTERNRVVNQIVRQDFYIACTCGYEGPALNGACASCGTRKLALSVQIASYLP